MKEVFEFLKNNPTFYIATIEDNKPKVRPFGFVMELEGKLYFATNNQKPIYKQLQSNPYFEISTTSETNQWIRLRGKAVFNSTAEVREKAFEVAPFFNTMYKTPDNPILQFFYIEEGEADFYSMTGESKNIKL